MSHTPDPITSIAHEKVDEIPNSTGVILAPTSSSSSSSSSSSTSSSYDAFGSRQSTSRCDPPTGFVQRLRSGGWNLTYAVALQVFAPSKLCCIPFSKVQQTDLVFRLMQHPELLRTIDLFMPLSSHPTKQTISLIDAITNLYSSHGICSLHETAFNDRRLPQRLCLQMYSCQQSLRQTPKLFYQHWRSALQQPLKAALNTHLIPDLASLVTDYVVGDNRDPKFVSKFVPDRSGGTKQFRLDLLSFKQNKLRKRHDQLELRTERFHMCGAEWEVLFYPSNRDHQLYRNHLWAYLKLCSFNDAVPEPPMQLTADDNNVVPNHPPPKTSGCNPHLHVHYEMGLVDLQKDAAHRLNRDEFRFEMQHPFSTRGWAIADLHTLERLSQVEDALTGSSAITFEVRIRIARDKVPNTPKNLLTFVPFERVAVTTSMSHSK